MGKLKLSKPSNPRVTPDKVDIFTHDIGDGHVSAHTSGYLPLGMPEFVVTGAASCSNLVQTAMDETLQTLLATHPMRKPLLGRVIPVGTFMVYLGDVTAHAYDIAPGSLEFALMNNLELRLIQIVMSDMAGHLPWDIGCLETFSLACQPVFFAHPAPLMVQ